MSLFTRLAAGTGFRRFMDFVSPAFFDVMPMGPLMREVKKLVASYRDEDAFAALAAEKTDGLAAIGVALRPEVEPRTRFDDLDEATRKAMGEAVLRVYFAQLLEPKPILLDLSRVDHGDPLVWCPGRGHASWDDGFRTALVAVYRSFYEGGDLPRALEPLGLASAADLFRKHFGEGDQSTVSFTVEHFVDSFHQVFVHCKERGIRLDPHFLGLGLYLATMYETLEALAVPLDVRSAFLAVSQSPTLAQ